MKFIQHFCFLVLFALLTMAVPAMAQEWGKNYYGDDITSETDVSPLRPESMVLIDSGTVTKVLKSNLILLNKKRYKLDNISTPAYEDQLAFNEVTNILLNKQVNIYSRTADETIDRYRIPLSHVVRDDGVWVQEKLISKGLAWATITGTNRPMIYALIKTEKKARDERKGFWSYPLYSVKTPYNLKNSINSYQIVEGKILYVSRKSSTAFLNFSKDWKTDFTIEIPNRILSKFTTPGESLKLKKWLNHTVRIRGWVQEKNGPMIKVKYQEQIEFLPNSSK